MPNDLLTYYAYNTALAALSPAMAGYCLYSAARARRPGSVLRQQFGLAAPDLPENRPARRVWIQAVSVGEAVASGPVCVELKRLLPDVELTLSTTTTTGQDMARKSIPEADNVIYFPTDVVPAVKRSLDLIRPNVFASVETEIWPNFLYHCRKRGIPVAIVNGIISDRTLRWGRRLGWMYRWALSGVDRLCMQSKTDADRVIELGARSDRVEVVGNCKFDQLPAGLSVEERRRLRETLKMRNGAPTIIGGSTNPGEEEQVLDAYGTLKQSRADLKLVLAPRQIDRAGSIESMVRSRGFSCGRRSKAEGLTGAEDVIILDTMGELAATYGVADVAFVGGSLIPKGGHNILQPIAHGLPTLYGPYMHKARDLARLAGEAGVGFQVADSAELARVAGGLLSDRAKLEDVRSKAVALIDRNRGASRRCAEAIAGLSELSDRRGSFALDTISGRASGPLPCALRAVLWVLSWVYRAGLAAFLLPYRVGIRKRRRLPCPVISIGNLTFGGTGKTPTVRAVASELLSRGLRPVILSRGHGGRRNRRATIVSDGNQRRISTQECGDEPAMLADLLRGVPVVIGKNRFESGMLAVRSFNPDVIVLDDGLQYWQLHRDLDVVLLNAVEPFGRGGVLPRGTLREPASGLRRAGAVVITNADRVAPDRLAQVKEQVAALAPNAAVLEALHRPSGLRFVGGAGSELSWLRGRRVCAMSSIGAPGLFRGSVADLGAEVVGEFDFPDHHFWTLDEMEAIGAEARRLAAEALVTTEKDAVKLPAGDFGVPIAVVDVTMEFRGGGLAHILLPWQAAGNRRPANDN